MDKIAWKQGKNGSNYAKTGRFLGIYFSSAAEFLPCFLAGWIFIPPLGVAFGHNIYPCKKAFPGWPPPPYYLLNFPILEQRIAPHQDLFWIPAGFLFSPGHWDKGDYEHVGPQPGIQSAEYVHFGQSAEYDTCTRKFFYGIQLCTPKMRICTPNVPAQNLGPNADTRKKVFIFNIWLCMASIPFLNYTV